MDLEKCCLVLTDIVMLTLEGMIIRICCYSLLPPKDRPYRRKLNTKVIGFAVRRNADSSQYHHRHMRILSNVFSLPFNIPCIIIMSVNIMMMAGNLMA